MSTEIVATPWGTRLRDHILGWQPVWGGPVVGAWLGDDPHLVLALDSDTPDGPLSASLYAGEPTRWRRVGGYTSADEPRDWLDDGGGAAAFRDVVDYISGWVQTRAVHVVTPQAAATAALDADALARLWRACHTYTEAEAEAAGWLGWLAAEHGIDVGDRAAAAASLVDTTWHRTCPQQHIIDWLVERVTEPYSRCDDGRHIADGLANPIIATIASPVSLYDRIGLRPLADALQRGTP